MSEPEVTVSVEGGGAPAANGELPGATEALINQVVETADGAADTAAAEAENAEAASAYANSAADNAASAAADAEVAANTAADSASTVLSAIEGLPARVAEAVRQASAEVIPEASPLPEIPDQGPDTVPEKTHWLNKSWFRGGN